MDGDVVDGDDVDGDDVDGDDVDGDGVDGDGVDGDGIDGFDGDGGDGGCFVAGTPVATERGLVPIEAIVVGDQVVSFDEASAGVTVQRVARAFRSRPDEVVVLDFADDQLRCTPGHRFYNGDWIPAGKLQPGDSVLDRDGRERQVQRVDRELGPRDVFNLRVESSQTYFVGTLGLLVHNVKKEDGDDDFDDPEKKAPEAAEEELRRRLRRQGPDTPSGQGAS